MNGANEVTSMRSSSRSASESPAVFVIDNDRSALDSIESLVRGAGWQSRLFSSAEQFLAMPRPMVPTCLVLDVSLPDGSGLELQNLLADHPDLPVVFLTAVRDVSVTVQAMKAGAVEFLTKPCSDEVLLRAIDEALHRSQQTLRQQAEKRLLRNRYTSLSVREREVMALVVAGLLNKQIGGELGIAEITVKVHRANVLRKMFARSVPDLVCMALTLQLVPDVIGPTRRTAEPTEKRLHDGKKGIGAQQVTNRAKQTERRRGHRYCDGNVAPPDRVDQLEEFTIADQEILQATAINLAASGG